MSSLAARLVKGLRHGWHLSVEGFEHVRGVGVGSTALGLDQLWPLLEGVRVESSLKEPLRQERLKPAQHLYRAMRTPCEPMCKYVRGAAVSIEPVPRIPHVCATSCALQARVPPLQQCVPQHRIKDIPGALQLLQTTGMCTAMLTEDNTGEL